MSFAPPRSGPMRTLAGLLLTAAFFALPGTAAVINDPTGDILPSYAGPSGDDLDIVQAEVIYDGTNFLFTSTSAGDIGTTPGTLFVWGVNRGAGTARFPTLAPGVLFDLVVVINPGAATLLVNDIAGGVATPLPGANISFSGANLSALVPASLLPSQGFSPSEYTVNLWPRVGTGNLDQITDFAPDNSNAAVTVVPEPGTALLLTSALGLLVVMRRRR